MSLCVQARDLNSNEILTQNGSPVKRKVVDCQALFSIWRICYCRSKEISFEKTIKDKCHQIPHSTVDYMIKKFLESGSLNRSQPPGRSSNDEYVSFVENSLPVKSVRSLSSSCGVSKSTVHRILIQKDVKHVSIQNPICSLHSTICSN